VSRPGEGTPPAEVDLGQLLEARSALAALVREVERARSHAEGDALRAAVAELGSSRPDVGRLAAQVERWRAEDRRRRDQAGALAVAESWLKSRTDERAKARPNEVAGWLRQAIAEAEAPGGATAAGPEGLARVEALRDELRGLEGQPARARRKKKEQEE
jgi:hypothetical protein